MTFSLLLFLSLYVLGITSQSLLQCHNTGECQSQELSEHESIECLGFGACSEANIGGSAASVDCNGYMGCYGATVSANEFITCNSANSCGTAHLSNAADIYCYGNEGCMKAVINANKVHSYGYRSAYKAVINAERVFGDGFHSIGFAQIDSVGREEINVFAYGFLAGQGANIFCRAGSNCKLFCNNDGCKDLNFNCYAGSKCVVSPEQCQSHQGELEALPTSALSAQVLEGEEDEYVSAYTYTPATNGVTCPNWVESDGESDDALIDRMVQSRLSAQKEQELVMFRETVRFGQRQSATLVSNVGVAVMTFALTAGSMRCLAKRKMKDDFGDREPLLV